MKSENRAGLSAGQKFSKRMFDILLATIGLGVTWWIIVFAFLLASIDTRSNGFFFQQRIGRNGKPFGVIKIKTMRTDLHMDTSVTTRDDPRITRLGRFFRITKIDELPQLINVLWGNMSFVGPRPDVPGFADRLQGDDKLILSVRPGITGPATLRYHNEEEIFARHINPEKYNAEVIFPDKVRMNRKYVENFSFWKDLKYILQTVFTKSI